MAKYNAFELRTMKAKGQTMPDMSYPIADAEDLDNAIKAVGMGNADHDSIRKYIMGRAKALGKSSMIPETWNADGSLASRSDSRPEYSRSFVLEDISIRAGGDGRTMDAYAAVFNMPASIRDQDGEYDEVIDPTAFNRAIDHHSRSGHRIPVMFNHGMTMFGTPSELDTMPIGVTEEIKADGRGLFTRARYHKSERADAVLEGIREGSISSYSFSGRFNRSEPAVPRGGFRRGSTVRRVESTLREYGPTPFPAYQGAEVIGVRAEQAAMLLGQLAPGERERLAELLRTGTHPDPPDLGTSLVDPAADDPPLVHSTRSPREELLAARARFIIRRGGDK